MSYEVPILLIVFRRPDTTLKVLEHIRKVNPKYLYVACDGPRPHVNGETEKVNEVKKIIEEFDLPGCNVKRMYNEHNAGIDELAIFFNWFFGEVEEGIVLEDDDIADPDFFHFCAELLEKYRNSDQVKYITGSNFVTDRLTSNFSYFFSEIPSFWGFATWRRVWNKAECDLVRTLSEEEYESVLRRGEKEHYMHFKNLFNYFRRGDEIGLDQKLMFDMWFKNGLAIVPSVNLISNIGVGHADAYSKGVINRINNLKRGTLPEVLTHPAEITVNRKYDLLQMKKIFDVPKSLWKRICEKILKFTR